MKPTSELLKEQRLKSGLTQEGLSLKSGIVTRLISRWENGTVKPNYNNIVKLKKAFNCKYEDLFTGTIEDFENLQCQTNLDLLRKDLIHQLNIPEELDWDYFLETAVRAQKQANIEKRNFTEDNDEG